MRTKRRVLKVIEKKTSCKMMMDGISHSDHFDVLKVFDFSITLNMMFMNVPMV